MLWGLLHIGAIIFFDAADSYPLLKIFLLLL